MCSKQVEQEEGLETFQIYNSTRRMHCKAEFHHFVTKFSPHWAVITVERALNITMNNVNYFESSCGIVEKQLNFQISPSWPTLITADSPTFGRHSAVRP